MEEAPTVYDRYKILAREASYFPELIDDLRSVFAEDATVFIREESVSGIEAILEFYRDLLKGVVDCSYYWMTTKVSDTILEAPWVAAIHLKGDRLLALTGFERACLNADGLIADLRNYPCGSD